MSKLRNSVFGARIMGLVGAGARTETWASWCRPAILSHAAISAAGLGALWVVLIHCGMGRKH